MAAITSANVTIHDSYEIGSRQGKFRAKRLQATVALTAQGAAAGDIPASAFGLSQITNAYAMGSLISSVRKGATIGISALGVDDNYIYPVSLIQGTDANRADAANLTGDLFVCIEGIPAS